MPCTIAVRRASIRIRSWIGNLGRSQFAHSPWCGVCRIGNCIGPAIFVPSWNL